MALREPYAKGTKVYFVWGPRPAKPRFFTETGVTYGEHINGSGVRIYSVKPNGGKPSVYIEEHALHLELGSAKLATALRTRDAARERLIKQLTHINELQAELDDAELVLEVLKEHLQAPKEQP